MDPTLQTIAVLLMASLPIYVYAYPDGKVTSSCVTMTPVHGVQAQTSSPPYTLTLDKYTYSAGEKIQVTLSSSATQFKGFLIQARSESSTTPVGSFVTTNSNTQTLTCTSAASSVSHTSSTAKPNIAVTWVAPASSTADIQIRAAVVQTEYVFWTNVLSAKITYVAFNNTSSTTVENSSTAKTPAASKPSVSNNGVQRTWTLGGLLLSCGAVIASLLA
ncbi:putative ferric-chelate reductase 1 [Bufo bufo]|uniref:putative ferric-chelate reductase 1 n=1 Tax=Bufo bufo TaxID=8384 RepID=UPI001ABDC51B|nr:putative ferric-chelate reductase 1 [Bufo bufo]XP_040263268.1 putative ferric-chelate reductase 1 [Bufo bufo]